MKLIFSLILLWALSSTAGALQCQTCKDAACSSTVSATCSSETMCITATILAVSSGSQGKQIFKACAPPSLCPAPTSQTFSVNLGTQSALASAMCCNTDNCNSETLTDPAPQSNNGLLCNSCKPSTGQCTTPLQCQGVENQCLQSTINSGSNTFPAYGCASTNLCLAAQSLGSLPFMQSVGNITNGPICSQPTTTAAPTTTTVPTTTIEPTTTTVPTTTIAPTTTTAPTTTIAPTTTTVPTTTIEPTTTTVPTTTIAPTTTTVPTTTIAPTTTTVPTTTITPTTTPAPTEVPTTAVTPATTATQTTTTTPAKTTTSDACSIRLGLIHLLFGLLLFTLN